MSYEVICVCGNPLRGERQRRHQVVPCANCGRQLFVLPGSPLEAIEEAAPVTPPTRSWLHSWAAATFLIGIGSLVLMLVAVLAAWLFIPPRPDDTAKEEGPERLLNKIEAGRQLLAQGKFHLARKILKETVSERGHSPKLLTPKQNHLLNQLQRQAELLAHLSLISLEEIVRQGTMCRDAKEWGFEFNDKHRGAGFLFDDEVRRDPQGRLALRNYVVEVNRQAIRLAFEDLTILQNVEVDDSPRLIFGARLASCELEKGGGWVIRFEPDSGVLLTDADAAQAASSVLLDPGLKATIERQRRWLEKHPGEPLGRQ